jgi:hypothetical protein
MELQSDLLTMVDPFSFPFFRPRVAQHNFLVDMGLRYQ